jgi:four helix bundle protein
MIKTFQDLDAWKDGHKLVLNIYSVTKKFPKDETFGLSMQMRRCAVSITSNIAEGFGRHSNKEKTQFYYISQGSLSELQNQLIIAKDVGYISEKKYEEIYSLSWQVHRIIHGLIKYAKAHS